MQTDELRAELTELANEVEPFAGDLPAIRRRVARRRSGRRIDRDCRRGRPCRRSRRSRVTRSSPTDVDVAGRPRRSTRSQLPRFDVAVVLPAGATADDARATCSASSTRLTRSSSTRRSPRASSRSHSRNDPQAKAVRARVLRRPHRRGASRSSSLARLATRVQQLTAARRRRPRPCSDDAESRHDDVEIFMQVKACRPADRGGARRNSMADPDVAQYQLPRSPATRTTSSSGSSPTSRSSFRTRRPQRCPTSFRLDGPRRRVGKPRRDSLPAPCRASTQTRTARSRSPTNRSRSGATLEPAAKTP